MAPASSDRGERATVLFVCTANRIRSPFAAAAARQIASDHGLALEVSSAGFAEGGLPAMEPMVTVASKWGIDLTDHVNRQISSELIAASDLIVTMTGTHVVDLVGTHPEALRRTVTLREAAAAAQAKGSPRWGPPAVRDWAGGVAERSLDVLLGGDMDIADPVGRSKRIHRRTATTIAELVEQLLVADPAETVTSHSTDLLNREDV